MSLLLTLTLHHTHTLTTHTKHTTYTTQHTIHYTTHYIPNLVLVCPSNSGSATFTLTTAVNPSRMYSPGMLVSLMRPVCMCRVCSVCRVCIDRVVCVECRVCRVSYVKDVQSVVQNVWCYQKWRGLLSEPGRSQDRIEEGTIRKWSDQSPTKDTHAYILTTYTPNTTYYFQQIVHIPS